MGEVAFDRLQFGEAADHYHQAPEIGVELGDPDLASIAVIQLGDIARRRRRQNAAVRLLQSAERDVAGAGLLTQVKRSQTLARTCAETGDRSAFEGAIGHAEIHAQALAGAGHLDEGVRLAIKGLGPARSYGSPRHVSRAQRMHDWLVAVWPRSEPQLVELREALAAR